MNKTSQLPPRPVASGFGQLPLDANRPAILVTNDDGYEAGGLVSLVTALRGLGRIIVCAPDSPRSGYSASYTSSRPINLSLVSDDGEVAVYFCNGTPVDCVKIALHRFFHERKPDLVLSGINHGGNDSVCVMYSGTMGAVLEGCAVGIPSIGFSLLNLSPTSLAVLLSRYWPIPCLVEFVSMSTSLMWLSQRGYVSVGRPMAIGRTSTIISRATNRPICRGSR